MPGRGSPANSTAVRHCSGTRVIRILSGPSIQRAPALHHSLSQNSVDSTLQRLLQQPWLPQVAGVGWVVTGSRQVPLRGKCNPDSHRTHADLDSKLTSVRLRTPTCTCVASCSLAIKAGRPAMAMAQGFKQDRSQDSCPLTHNAGSWLCKVWLLFTGPCSNALPCKLSACRI